MKCIVRFSQITLFCIGMVSNVFLLSMERERSSYAPLDLQHYQRLASVCFDSQMLKDAYQQLNSILAGINDRDRAIDGVTAPEIELIRNQIFKRFSQDYADDESAFKALNGNQTFVRAPYGQARMPFREARIVPEQQFAAIATALHETNNRLDRSNQNTIELRQQLGHLTSQMLIVTNHIEHSDAAIARRLEEQQKSFSYKMYTLMGGMIVCTAIGIGLFFNYRGLHTDVENTKTILNNFELYGNMKFEGLNGLRDYLAKLDKTDLNSLVKSLNGVEGIMEVAEQTFAQARDLPYFKK